MEQTTNYQREVKITKSRRENLLNLFTYMCMHIFKKYSMSHCSVLFLEFIKLEFRNIRNALLFAISYFHTYSFH